MCESTDAARDGDFPEAGSTTGIHGSSIGISAGAQNRRKPILPSLFLCCISAVEFDIFREVNPLSS
jgi:hypothetical protein